MDMISNTEGSQDITHLGENIPIGKHLKGKPGDQKSLKVKGSKKDMDSDS